VRRPYREDEDEGAYAGGRGGRAGRGQRLTIAGMLISHTASCYKQECRSRQRARKKKRLTGAGMVKAENSFMVKEKLLEATAPAATSRSGLMATNTTPRC